MRPLASVLILLMGLAAWALHPTGALFNDTTVSGGNELSAVECFACDVEVVSLDAPDTIILSFTYDVDVTLRNNGTGSIPTTVTLHDTTNDILIGSTDITLAPGETRVVTFSWTPDNFLVSAVVIRARADSPRDPDLSNNWQEKTILLIL